jgi:hypothetical protein
MGYLLGSLRSLGNRKSPQRRDDVAPEVIQWFAAVKLVQGGMEGVANGALAVFELGLREKGAGRL